MTDWHGKGRWGTGSRPLQTGPEQSAYDVGAQQRRADEERRAREQRDYFDRQRKDREEQQRRRDREHAERLANRSSDPSARQASSEPAVYSDDDLEFDDWLRLAAIGVVTFFMIKLWGMATASLAPSNAILAAIVDHGVWGVGLLGIGLGIRFQDILLPVAKIALVLLVLFFGSAFVVGLYQGLTG